MSLQEAKDLLPNWFKEDPNDKEQILKDLVDRKRQPQNEWEQKVMKEIEAIEAKGGIVEIPFN